MALSFQLLEISNHVERKINSLHGVTGEDVIEALEAWEDRGWDDDPERGRRLLVIGRAGKRRLMIVLHPIDVGRGEWRLATAYPEDRP